MDQNNPSQAKQFLTADFHCYLLVTIYILEEKASSLSFGVPKTKQDKKELEEQKSRGVCGWDVHSHSVSLIADK